MAEPAFVLIHGAWHGGWCWRRVSPLLRQSGYSVYAPTLTGLGDRVHLLGPDVDLTTHVNDVLNLLRYEEIDRAILVGHSYAGMVISEVAEQAESRIDQLVYLDAFLPDHDRSIRDYGPAAQLDQIAAEQGDGWRIPTYMSARDFGISDEADIAWVDRLLGDQPYGTFQQAVDLSTDAQSRLRCAYIRTSENGFIDHASRAREHGFAYRELFSAGHDAMVTEPERLAALLVELHQGEQEPGVAM